MNWTQNLGNTVLDAAGKTALQNYFNKGGNFMGIHASSDGLRTTDFYGNETGAYLYRILGSML